MKGFSLLLLLWAQSAAAAVVIPFQFTAPADYLDSTRTNPVRCARYEATWWVDMEGVGKNVYNGPRGYLDGLAVPNEPGTPDTVWAVFTSSAPEHGVMYLWAFDLAGNKALNANGARLVTFARSDTLMAWVREDSTFIQWAKVRIVDGISYTIYQHAMEDSPAMLLSQTGVQAESMLAICSWWKQWGSTWPDSLNWPANTWPHSGAFWPCPEDWQP